jgi:hypothetical protein
LIAVIYPLTADAHDLGTRSTSLPDIETSGSSSYADGPRAYQQASPFDLGRARWLGAGIGFKVDGSEEAGAGRNPLTELLVYPGVSLEFGTMAGWAGVDWLGVHVMATGGSTGAHATAGHYLEVGGGLVLEIAGPVFSVGARADVALAAVGYRRTQCCAEALFEAVIVEPRFYIAANLEEGMYSLGFLGGPRWKWIVGRSHPEWMDVSPQVGASFEMILLRRF